MKKYLLPFVSIMFIILISTYPVQSLNGAQYGLSAFLGTVMPALLPFFAATTILVRSGACDWIASLFGWAMKLFRLPGDAAMALLVSFLSGYPAGAKAVSELHSAGSLSDGHASVAYVLCSTTGPAFILGTIGAMVSVNCGLYIMLPHFLSAMAVGVAAGFIVNPKPLEKRIRTGKSTRDSAAGIVVESISSAAGGLWRVASFMMFFSSLTFVLSELGLLNLVGRVFDLPLQLLGMQSNLGSTLASGMLEMTSGCLSAVYVNASYNSIVPLLSFMISFGGLSILMQIFTFSAESNVKLSFLTGFKLVQGIISMLLTTLLMMLFPIDVETFSMAAPVMGKVEIGMIWLLIIAAFPLGVTIVSMLKNKGYRRKRV